MIDYDYIKKNTDAFLLIAVVIFFSFYFALGSYHLLNNNEGLYASIAKNMLENKSFIIPHLNCVPYIEKPPLLYWLLSLSFSAFGATAFAARFVTSTSATLLCCMMLYFSYKIKKPQIGFMATIIFSSSIGIAIIARMVYFDMLLTFLISGALLCLFYWYKTEAKSSLRIAYIFLGLAILAKGFIAIIIIGGSFGLFLMLEKKLWPTFKESLDPLGITLFLAVILPWHIAATVQHKGFAWNYFINEQFLRFLNKREPHDYYHGSIYYYLPRIIIYLFPWSFFIPLIFWRKKTDIIAKEYISSQKFLRFCWCALLVPLIFFSVSGAKANYYMVVGMPALAFILGIKINILLENNLEKTLNIWVAIILFFIATTLTFILRLPEVTPIKLQLISTIIYTTLAGIISLIFIRHSKIALILLALLIIPLGTSAISYVKSIEENISAANVGIYLTKNAQNHPIYIYQNLEDISAISFYTNQCFKIVDSKSSDLYYGSQLPEYKKWFVTKKEFYKETANKSAFLIVPQGKKAPRVYSMHIPPLI